MSDPRRWCDDPRELSEVEQRALEAGRSAGPPPGLRDELWETLSAALAGPGGGGAGGGADTGMGGASEAGGSLSATTQALGAASIVKFAAIGAAIGTIVMVSATALGPRPDTNEGPVTASAENGAAAAEARASATARMLELEQPAAQAAHATPRAVGPQHELVRQSESARPPASAVAAFPDAARLSDAPPAAVPSTSSPVVTSAREESRLIASARDALRAGNPTLALGWLEQARARFPHGVLAQEREALGIEALAASGQHAQARARAREFISTYPGSPYISRIEASLSAASDH